MLEIRVSNTLAVPSFAARSGGVLTTRQVLTSGLATGGGTLAADRTITVTAASDAEAITGTATNRAMTPAADKAALDAVTDPIEADVVALEGRQIIAAGLATGGGTLAADRTITVPAASDAETITGSLTTKAVTPASDKAALDAAIGLVDVDITAVEADVAALEGRQIIAAGLATGGGTLAADRTITVAAASNGETIAGSLTNKAVTPAGDKAALDAKVDPILARSISATGLATGGGTLAADRTITVTAASNAETITGTSTTKAVTPAADKAALDAAIAAFVLPTATDAEAVTGTATNLLMTPATDRAALDEAFGEEFPSVRPGETPRLFTAALTGALSASTALTPAMSVVDTDGTVLRAAVPQVVATRQVWRVEPGRIYRARYVFRRRINTGDPANDAVRCAIRWLTASKAGVATSGTTVVADLTDLTTGSGRTEVEATIATAAGDNIDFVAPAAAVYARPYVQTFGDDPTTDVEVISWTDITDASVFAPDVSSLSGRVTAIESIDAGDRLDAAEALLSAPEVARFKTLAAADAATIPAGVDIVETLSLTTDGDGDYRHWYKVGAEPAHSRKFQSTDGAWWEGRTFKGIWPSVPSPLIPAIHLQGTTPAAHTPSSDTVIHCWGDSITYHYMSEVNGGVIPGAPVNGSLLPRGANPWPETMSGAIASVWPSVAVVNKGFSGDNIEEIFSRITADTPAATVKIAMIMCGTNDSTVGAGNVPVAGASLDLDDHIRFYAMAIELLQSRGQAVVIIGPSQLEGWTYNTRVQMYAAAQKKLAAEYGIPFIDTREIFRQMPQPWWSDGTHLANNASLNLGRNLAAFILAGGHLGHSPPSVQVGPGSVLTPQDVPGVAYDAPDALFGYNYTALAAARTGKLITLPIGSLLNLPLYFSEELVPVVTLYNADAGTTRTISVISYYDPTAPVNSTRTISHTGDATYPRRRFRLPPFQRGWRLIQLYNLPGSAAEAHIESIHFEPVRGSTFYGGHGLWSKPRVDGFEMPDDLGAGVDWAALDESRRIYPPFRYIARVRLPTAKSTGIIASFNLDYNDTAEQMPSRIFARMLRDTATDTAVIFTMMSNGTTVSTTTFAGICTAGVDFEGVLELRHDGTNLFAYIDGVLKGTYGNTVSTMFPGVACTGPGNGFLVRSAAIKD